MSDSTNKPSPDYTTPVPDDLTLEQNISQLDLLLTLLKALRADPENATVRDRFAKQWAQYVAMLELP